MALSGDALGLAIKAAVDALSAEEAADREELFKTMGNAIVSYLVANAVVTVTSVSGVTTGPSASGPGTGSIS